MATIESYLATTFEVEGPDRDVIALQLVEGAKKRKVKNKVDLAAAIKTVAITDVHKGSSTLEITLLDPGFDLLASKFFDPDKDGRLNAIELNYPRRSRFWWALTQVSVNAREELVLTYMERVAVALMSKKGPVKAKSRAKMTRAQFIQWLVLQAEGAGKIDYHSRELKVQQPTDVALGSRLLYLGDSLGVGTVPELRKKVGYPIDAKVKTSEDAAWGYDRLVESLGPKHFAVVFDLGTNDGNNPGPYISKLVDVRAKIGSRLMIVLTLNGTAAGMNDEIRDWVANTSQTKLVEWVGDAGPGDGIHGNYDVRAARLANAIPKPRPAQGDQQVSEATREKNKDGGINQNQNLKIKGDQASPGQLRQVERALDATANLNAPALAYVALICAGIGESSFTAEATSSAGAKGVFQVMPFWWDQIPWQDTEKQARRAMLEGYYGKGGLIDMVKSGRRDINQMVIDMEGSDAGTSDFYSQFEDEARALLEAYGGTGFGGLNGGVTTRFKEYNFDVGSKDDPHESFWDAINRLADEVNWSFLIDGNDVYYDSETTLIKQKPIAVIRRQDASVVDWDYTWDARRIATEMSLELICKPWAFRAGQVFQMENFGPASRGSTAALPGRWLISQIERDEWELTSQFTLVQPTRPNPEPAPEVIQQQSGAGAGFTGSIKGLTPKQVIDQVVLPIANDCGIARTVAENDAANASHGATVSGGTSDHQGPSNVRWAADMSNGTSPTPEMDKLFRALCKEFDIPGSLAGGIFNATHSGFRFQIIYRCNPCGGDHTNHVHFGLEVTSSV